LNQRHGASITNLVRIGRRERSLHYLFEDADFSTYRIKKLIADGEKDAAMSPAIDARFPRYPRIFKGRQVARVFIFLA
jgi:hypothetical protein